MSGALYNIGKNNLEHIFMKVKHYLIQRFPYLYVAYAGGVLLL
jgi:hypothetical protein